MGRHTRAQNRGRGKIPIDLFRIHLSGNAKVITLQSKVGINLYFMNMLIECLGSTINPRSKGQVWAPTRGNLLAEREPASLLKARISASNV